MKLMPKELKAKNGEKYSGMNLFAARELGIPYPHNSHTLLVWSGLSLRGRAETFEHEKNEVESYRKHRKENPPTRKTKKLYPQTHAAASKKDAEGDIKRMEKPESTKQMYERLELEW